MILNLIHLQSPCSHIVGVVTMSHSALCDPMDCSTPGYSVLHYLPMFAQTHIHWVSDAIQPPHPLSPFSSCPQSFLASDSFPMSQLFTYVAKILEYSASASVLSMNIHGWYPLGLIGLISLLSKGLTRVFSSTTVWKHEFFSIQPSLQSSSHIHTWLLEKP